MTYPSKETNPSRYVDGAGAATYKEIAGRFVDGYTLTIGEYNTAAPLPKANGPVLFLRVTFLLVVFFGRGKPTNNTPLGSV